MLFLLADNNFILILGVAFAFIATMLLMIFMEKHLPHDHGRAFAIEGELSKGKARGAGILFVLVLIMADLIFNVLSVEKTIYLVIIAFTMLSGFMDDASEKPWSEYLKGAIDLALAIATAFTYLYYNGNTFKIAVLSFKEITIPYPLYGILIVVLVWVAINVTNCSDGVDGLCGSLSIITIGSFYLMMRQSRGIGDITYTMMLFMVVLSAYLWFNANPSTILMGDAGSRAIGIFIAIIALKSSTPLIYLMLSLVMILDGGLGLIKVALKRFLKISILKNVRCPLHDQARKVYNWSNTQVVFRFVIIQIIINVLTVWAYWMIRESMIW